MASSIDIESCIETSGPAIVVGLPGVGSIGKLAADLMAKELNAEVFARIYSSDLPPQVLVGEDCSAKPICIELALAKAEKQDIVFVLGESQASTPSGQYDLTEFIFNALLPYDPSFILTLGGYGTGDLKQSPRLLGVVTDPGLKPRLEEAGAGLYAKEPKGGIVGAAALFLTMGKRYGIPAASLIGETSGYIVDHRGASHVVQAANALLGTDVSVSEYSDMTDLIDEASKMAVRNESIEAPREDLSYIQ